MKGDTETLEGWVERINNQTVWREVAVLIGNHCPPKIVEKAYKKAIEGFVKDTFSLRWPIAPKNITFDVSDNAVQHATNFIISARQEVTRKAPLGEKLWVALRYIYEEAENLKAANISLRDSITEMENQIKELEKLVGK